MLIQLQSTVRQNKQHSTTDDLVVDMVDLFLDLNGGHLGKHCYDGANWDALGNSASAYYVPKADEDLALCAKNEIYTFLPKSTDYLDFGVGGSHAFLHHAIPIIEQLQSKKYIAVDYCAKALETVEMQRHRLGKACGFKKIQTDFFAPNNSVLNDVPALGVMNGLTITNIYGRLWDENVAGNLIRTLKQILRMTNYGWLLLSIDTNKDETALHQAYNTPGTSKLYLNVFHRLQKSNTTSGFDPGLFKYEPSWQQENQLLAHTATATENQHFLIDNKAFRIKKGENFHLLNSYKFAKGFFEDCCTSASLEIVKVWHHETPMKLYLLKSGI